MKKNYKITKFKINLMEIYRLFLILTLLLVFFNFNNFDFINYHSAETACNCIYKYDNPWPYKTDIYNCDGRYATSGWWYFKTIGIATFGYIFVSMGTVLVLHYRGELE